MLSFSVPLLKKENREEIIVSPPKDGYHPFQAHGQRHSVLLIATAMLKAVYFEHKIWLQ